MTKHSPTLSGNAESVSTRIQNLTCFGVRAISTSEKTLTSTTMKTCAPTSKKSSPLDAKMTSERETSEHFVPGYYAALDLLSSRPAECGGKFCTWVLNLCCETEDVFGSFHKNHRPTNWQSKAKKPFPHGLKLSH